MRIKVADGQIRHSRVAQSGAGQSRATLSRATLSRATLSRYVQSGVTLIETIIFIVVVSIGLGALLMVFNQSVVKSVDPVIRIKALEKGQALMDEILARKFAENTPTGGVPACNSAAGSVCAGIAADSDFDDVGDYHGYTDNSDTRFPVNVVVQEAGGDFGIASGQARRVTLRVGMPDGNALTLSAYKVNF